MNLKNESRAKPDLSLEASEFSYLVAAYCGTQLCEPTPKLVGASTIRTFDGQRLPSADWHIVRSIVMERVRYACIYRGSDKQLEADHILPLSRGGSNVFSNLATACRPRNLSKGSKTVEDWETENARLGIDPTISHRPRGYKVMDANGQSLAYVYGPEKKANCFADKRKEPRHTFSNWVISKCAADGRSR